MTYDVFCDKEDCFACVKKDCQILRDNDFGWDRECPFYKPKEERPVLAYQYKKAAE